MLRQMLKQMEVKAMALSIYSDGQRKRKTQRQRAGQPAEQGIKQKRNL